MKRQAALLFNLAFLTGLLLSLGSLPVIAHLSLADENLQTSAVAGIHINEVLFSPAAGQTEWVEIKNSGSGTAGINGYGLTDEDGNWYRFPDALPAVPPGAFVLLILDGAGSGGDD